MPRNRKSPERKPVAIPSNSLVASAHRYPGKAARIYVPSQDWQAECYRHYAICGEARFAARFFGNAVSRATLHAALMEGGEPKRQDSGPEFEALAALFSGNDGQREILHAIGTHLTIAGECYLVGRHTEDAGDVWEVISCLEMKVSGTQWTIKYGNGQRDVMLTEDDVVIRIWLPHPARRLEADSPFRAMLPLLNEIEWLTRHVFAQVSSRLAGAGILLMPQEMSFPPPPPQDGKEVTVTNNAEGFMLSLADSMMEPIENPASPAALVPIVVTAPGDQIDKPRLLQFWSELDENAMSLRTEAIRRFALGMDLPPEQVLGMSSNSGTGGGTSNGVSHWGAWQIEEATIKMHVEPMLDVIVNALTISYLRNAVEATPGLIVYDTSALRLRPDRSKEAMELYDRGLISASVVLRENGFKVTDMPDEDEFRHWLLVKIASGSATPEQMQAALGALGIDLPVAAIPEPGVPRELPQPPSVEDHPTRPRTPGEEAAALLHASEALVFRALERAGNRLRQAGTKPPCPSYETHVYAKANGTAEKLLDDAWSCAPQVLDGLADAEEIVPVLNAYCLSLLNEQSPHERGRLAEWLSLALPERSDSTRAAVRSPMVFNLAPPEVTVNIPPPPPVTVNVDPTPVNITNDIQVDPTPVINHIDPTPVTVQNEVSPTPVEVKVGPTPVTVEAPNVEVKVDPTPVEVNVEQPKPRKVRRKVIRNSEGQITAVEGTE